MAQNIFNGTNRCKIMMVKFGTIHLWTESKPTANSTFAIGGVSCSTDSFVVAESSVLRMNICADKPAHRKSANRLSIKTKLNIKSFF